MNRDHESDSAPAGSHGFARATLALAHLRVACADLVASHERVSRATTALGHAATDMLVAVSRLPLVRDAWSLEATNLRRP